MAKVPERAEITISVENGTVTFSIEDDERLENIDKTIYRWSKIALSKRLGFDVENVEVERE